MGQSKQQSQSQAKNDVTLCSVGEVYRAYVKHIVLGKTMKEVKDETPDRAPETVGRWFNGRLKSGKRVFYGSVPEAREQFKEDFPSYLKDGEIVYWEDEAKAKAKKEREKKKCGGVKKGNVSGRVRKMKAVESVVGSPNWKNRSVFAGDNLDVLKGMDSGSVDLVYLDPPFNSNRNYEATKGSKADGNSFKDVWTENELNETWLGEISDRNEKVYAVCKSAGVTHSTAMKVFLAFMSMRIFELYRVLRPTGSIYLHIDTTASHYLKQILDAVFGNDSFRNEIVWGYRGGGVPRNAFARKHDIILCYAKGKENVFNKQYVPYSEASQELVSSRGGTSIDGKERDLERGASMPDYWTDINALQTWSPERTGYPTQKPLALLERIIETSSNEGDVVLDPFAGCGTTCEAAERLGRQWVGIDLNKDAYKLICSRLERAVEDGALEDVPDVFFCEDGLVRTGQGVLLSGYYEG